MDYELLNYLHFPKYFPSHATILQAYIVVNALNHTSSKGLTQFLDIPHKTKTCCLEIYKSGPIGF